MFKANKFQFGVVCLFMRGEFQLSFHKNLISYCLLWARLVYSSTKHIARAKQRIGIMFTVDGHTNMRLFCYTPGGL